MRASSPRLGLTRELLIETALRLLDEAGLEGLTVRRLAAELGVRSPALYWHIRTKQELLDGMADRMIQAAEMGPPHDGESWQDWLARRARAYRRSVLAHRDGARIVATAAWLTPATIRMFDTELAALVAHGFSPGLAFRTMTVLTQYVNGFVLQEQAVPGKHAVPPSDLLAAVADLLDGDTAAPLLIALRGGISTIGDEAFEHGLRLLISGTSTLLEAHQV